MKRILLAGAALVALSSASFAADFAAPAEEVDVWSGFYAGLQVGYGFGDVETTPGPDIEIDGPAGGLYYGRNWQFDSIVLGLDGSLSIADINGDATDGFGDNLDLTIEGFSTSRVRLGMAFDNILVFVAGGGSIARLESDFFDAGTATTLGDDEWMLGWTIGGGVDYKVGENWSARLEYMYINYGDDEDVAIIGGPDVVVDTDMHVVRGGVAYHF